MNAARHVWRELAPLFGLADIVPDADGRVCLRLGADGTLHLESRDDALLMCLARPCGDPGAPLPTLTACDARRIPLPVRAGLRAAGPGSGAAGEDLLVLALRFSAGQRSLPAVARGLDLLTELHRRIAEGEEI